LFLRRRTALKAVATGLLPALAPGWAAASRFPERPIALIVPFAPGGIADLTARAVAEQMARTLGQAVVVENKPSAGSIVASQAVASARPDGHTLLLMSNGHAVSVSLFRKLPYDPEKDFVLVGHFGDAAGFMLVRPEAPWKTMADFIAAAKAAPGKLNYGYFNASSQVPGALLGSIAGIELTPVPYKQIGNAMTDLIAGQIDVIFVDSAAGDSFVASGQLRARAAAGAKRLAKYPQLPLISESYPSYSTSGFLGVAAPAGTPPAVLQALNDLVNEAVHSEPMKSRLEGFGFVPRRMTLAQLAVFEREERVKWKGYVAIAKIVPQ
jgi:tripartite-type tricarboxylate transporter receptor subunit TctC